MSYFSRLMAKLVRWFTPAHVTEAEHVADEVISVAGPALATLVPAAGPAVAVVTTVVKAVEAAEAPKS